MEKKKLPSPYDYDKLGAYCAALVEAGAAANHKEAAELARKAIPPEKKIQKQIMDYLRSEAPDAFFWKDAAGPYQQQGIPDIVGVLRGAFYAFEVKRPLLGKLTPVQAETLAKINRAGGAAFVVTGVEDVRRCLGAGIGPADDEVW